VQVMRHDIGIIIATGIGAIFIGGIIGACIGAFVFISDIPEWRGLITNRAGTITTL